MTDQSIAKHISYLKRRNARESTITHRRGQLDRLGRFLGKPLLEATEEDLDRWQCSLRVCASSVQTYSSHVSAFYAWAHDTNLLDRHMARNLVMPRIKRRLPRPIPEKDLEVALITSQYDAQLYGWFLLAGYCGLRASEISQVARSDFREVDNGGAFLTVHGKGGKERIVRVPPDVFAELQMFMVRQGCIFRRPSDGKAFTPNGVTRGASAHLKGIGLPYTIHTLRHRFGTKLADLGADPRDIQEAMGHEDLATTSIYLAGNVRRGAKSVDKLGAGLRLVNKRRPSRAKLIEENL
ncbi:tyrosine-type recombinase/integrase [Rhodococcoides fascians]|uniref:tyrosine-type recombinase/integrase n=1 Tax=Rhodococcoides fascians TaxID=1828 RepID=UPI00050C0586|nr:tyrosine-type recombinase/integrase [Rhodococcus fascians]